MKGISQDFYRRLIARDYYVSTEKHSSISAPSSNRSCGFPAYGSPEDCHQRHTQGAMRLGPLKVNQPESLQVIMVSLPFRQPKGPLAPSSQVDSHPIAHKVVYFPECLAGITQLKVVAPAPKMPVYPLDKIRYRNMATSEAGHLAQTLLFSVQTLLGREQVQIPVGPSFQIFIKSEGKAQEVQALPFMTQVNDPGLFAADFQTHPGFYLPSYPVLETDALVSGKDNKSSSPGESHPQALTEPDVNVSAHPAPMVQPLRKAVSNEQTSLAVSLQYALANVLLVSYDPSNA